jgi:purine-binding chemotaxis protein CheW
VRARAKGPIGDELQFIVFRTGPREYAVGILQVQRVLPYQEPVAGAGGPAIGLLEFGGRKLPVLDLRRRLGVPAPIDDGTRILVLDLEGLQAGLVVDRVTEVIRVDSVTIAPPREDDPVPFASGEIARGDRRLTVMHPGRVLSPEERSALAAVPA